MFPLSHMMKAFIAKGRLEIIDAAGKRHVFAGEPGPAGDPHPSVVMRLHDPRLYRDLVFKSEIAAAEAYMDGTMTFEEGSELRDFLRLFSINRLSLAAYPLQQAIRKATMLTRRRQQSNKRGEAETNVAHHYDLGNAFYRLFLDENMLYSCAYFQNANESLEQAQRNKLRLLAAKMELKPGQRVLDIGCGWGDLALYLASIADVHVTGVTLSKEQQRLAGERAERLGLADRVEFRLQDYREVPETFDCVVSVGMFEHVGVAHYDEFFDKLNALLPPDGLAVIHSIGHMSPPGMASKFMRKYIFPGAYSPALSEVFAATERNSLWCLDVEILRTHYADTLMHWERRFQSNRAEIEGMYDARFARMWEFYLLSAEAMFRTGSQMVFQMQLARSRDAAPLQRDYITDTQRHYEQLEAERSITLGQAVPG